MELHFADTLLDAIAENGSPVCVGLDPVWEKLPEKLRVPVQDEVEQTVMIGEFCHQVL